MEARHLWDEVAELESALSKYKQKAEIPEKLDNMYGDFVDKYIANVQERHPELMMKYEDKLPKIEGDLPEVYARLGLNEFDWNREPEHYDVSDEPKIVQARAELA